MKAFTRFALAALGLAAAAAGVQACGMDTPLPTSPVVGARNAPAARQVTDEPSFTPFSKAPQLTNRNEVVQALHDNYPPLVKQAGVGGKTDIWLRIGASGVVERVVVHNTSGHEPLDLAALRVGRVMRFTPAEDRGEVTTVWVSVPIVFQPDQAAPK